MKYQISSGKGPEECELAVKKFLDYLKKCHKLEVLSKTEGKYRDTYKSVFLECEEDLSIYLGSLKWVCKSPYRPNHSRKNWFIDFSVHEQEECCSFDEREVRFETFRSSGPGGQHVNTTDSGVRAVHIPTGISACSTQERSQFMNKKMALKQLTTIFYEKNQKTLAEDKNKLREMHTKIERGNEKVVFKGQEFHRKF